MKPVQLLTTRVNPPATSTSSSPGGGGTIRSALGWRICKPSRMCGDMTALLPDTDPQAERVLIDLLRHAPVARKLEMLGQMNAEK